MSMATSLSSECIRTVPRSFRESRKDGIWNFLPTRKSTFQVFNIIEDCKFQMCAITKDAYMQADDERCIHVLSTK